MRSAGIAVIICFIALIAIGQQEVEVAPHQTGAKAQLESCRAAMPAIFKNYNNAKYALFRAANSGDDAAHILGPVREAQATLDAMEQPLKGCYEAMQNTQAEQEHDNKK